MKIQPGVMVSLSSSFDLMYMFIFNTTFSVENNSISDWKNWMKCNFIPTFSELLPNLEIKLFELMMVVQEDSTNFSCQVRCANPEELEVINKYANILMDNLKGTFGEKCLHFSSILKEMELN